MKVSNNYGQINTNSGAGINAAKSNALHSYIPFQQNLYTTAPKKPITPANKTIPLTGLYSSKLLLSTFSKPNYIYQFIQNNPNIENILASHGLKTEIHPENVLNMQNAHLQTTNIIAQQLASQMGLSQADKQILEQAAMFHDFGKILIPEEILNKPDVLTCEEKEIMDLHSELGYELLSKSGLNKRTLDLIKNHHTPQKSKDVLCHILSVADIYSALREQRSYKKPLTNAQAIQILDQKAKDGEVSTEVVNALKIITKDVA